MTELNLAAGLMAMAALIFAGFRMYEKNSLMLGKLRKAGRDRRRTKAFISERKSSQNAIRRRIVLISAVLTGRTQERADGILPRVAAAVLMPNVLAAILILISGRNVFLRMMVLAVVNLLVFRLLWSVCALIMKRDCHKLVTGIRNEVLLENEIITCAKKSSRKLGKSMVWAETEKTMNDILKNSRFDDAKVFGTYLKATTLYEIPLVFAFLAGASQSGNRESMKKNLMSLESYCASAYESFKDYLFAKTPYLAIILLMPLFLFWTDAFSAEMMVQGVATQEPKEYIYLFSGLLSYVLLEL